MREYSSPLNVEIAETGNLTDDLVTNAAEAPGTIAFSRRTGEGWEVHVAGGAVGAGLGGRDAAVGVHRGDG